MYNSIFFRSEDSLRALIQKRHNDRAATADNFFSALEAKYGGKASKERSTKKRKQKKETEEAEKLLDQEWRNGAEFSDHCRNSLPSRTSRN